MSYYVQVVVLLLLILNLQSFADDKGHLVIIGGGERAPVLLNKISELAGGPDGKIVIIPAANSNPLEIALLQRYEFEKTGIGEVKFVLLDNPDSADSDSILAILDDASGIFFSGGSQRQLATALKGTKLLQRVFEIYKQGGVIAGTSAGAAVMSKMMITGGEKNSPDSTSKFVSIRSDNIVTMEGFGFLPDVIIDQHFLRRKRNNRLISLVIENPQLLGIGIDESTAIWVKPDHTFEVIGWNSVMILDAAKSTGINTDNRHNYAVNNMLLHLLTSGQSYDLSARKVIE